MQDADMAAHNGISYSHVAQIHYQSKAIALCMTNDKYRESFEDAV